MINFDRRVIAGTVFLVLVAVVGVTAYLFTQGTFADVTTEDSFKFASNPNDLYQVSNGMTFYGKKVSVENLLEKKDSNQPVAVINYGSRSERVTRQEFSEGVEINDLRFELVKLDGCSYAEVGSSLDSFCNDQVNNVLYKVDVNVPKDKITVEVSDLTFTDVSQGVKKVEATVVVNNDWRDVEADRVYLEMLGEEINIDSGVIEKGSEQHEVTFKKNYYDPRKFIVDKKLSGDAVVRFENARVPQGRVSGKPERDGDWRTSESFASGGSTPDIQAIKDGDYDDGSSGGACDIKYLRDHGLDTRNCKDYVGGEAVPQDTQNHEFDLKDFRSVSFNYSSSVNYCGENASYQDGECVIDEKLHLRGDLCPLLNNHQIVTETFPAGEKVEASDLEPEPSFFCTKHPVLVTDSDGSQTEFITDPYRDLVSGESFKVPEGKTYTMYWTVNTDQQDVSTVCKEGSFNSSSGECVRTPGVTHNCKEGVYDPSTGSCVVEPESQNICSVGRFNSELEKCQYEPDGNDQCSVGYFDNATDSCLAPSSVSLECPDNAVQEDGECRVQPSVVKQTPWEDLKLALERVVAQFFRSFS